MKKAKRESKKPGPVQQGEEGQDRPEPMQEGAEMQAEAGTEAGQGGTCGEDERPIAPLIAVQKILATEFDSSRLLVFSAHG